MLGAQRGLTASSCLLAGLALGLFSTGCAIFDTSKTVRAQPESTPTEESPRSVSIVPQDSATPPTSSTVVRQSVPANVAQHTFSTIGRDFDPDIAPDGQVLVFASTAHSERPDVYVKAVDGFAVTQITFDAADDVQPRFSPDGQSIAFSSNRAGNWDIWIVNRDGTGLTQVTRERIDEIAPCWSPDGKRLVFSAWGPRSNQWELWTVSVEHPGTRRFICPGLFPAWSADGTRIAFQRPRQRGSRWFGVWAVDFVGEEARHPTELAWDDNAACIAPRWAADGRTLAYSVVPLNAGKIQSASLWTVDTQTGVRHALTDDSITAFNPTWAQDGRVFFVSATGGIENIWSVPSGMDAEFASRPAAGAAEHVVLNQPAAAREDER
jgi:TolB protein